MRGIYTSVTDIRRKVFTEVARLAYEGGDYSRLEQIPYKIVPGEEARYRESIFLERAIVGERLRLAMGLPLRPISEHSKLTEGVDASHQREVLRSAAREHHQVRVQRLPDEAVQGFRGLPGLPRASVLRGLPEEGHHHPPRQVPH